MTSETQAPNTIALNRRLILLKLAPPGGLTFGSREDELFTQLQATNWINFAIHAQRLNQHHDDIVQDVLFSLCEEVRMGVLHSLNSEYVKTKVRFLATSIHRRREHSSLDQTNVPARISSGDEQEVLRFIRDVLGSMEPSHRRVLELSFPELDSAAPPETIGMAQQEIAELVKKSVATVSRRRCRAISFLAEKLREAGYDYWADRWQQRQQCD